jgi:hypothetical protein
MSRCIIQYELPEHVDNVSHGHGVPLVCIRLFVDPCAQVRHHIYKSRLLIVCLRLLASTLIGEMTVLTGPAWEAQSRIVLRDFPGVDYVAKHVLLCPVLTKRQVSPLK